MDGRYTEQKERLEHCGLRSRYYLVEVPYEYKARPSLLSLSISPAYTLSVSLYYISPILAHIVTAQGDLVARNGRGGGNVGPSSAALRTTAVNIPVSSGLKVRRALFSHWSPSGGVPTPPPL